MAKHQDLISLKVVFLPQVSGTDHRHCAFVQSIVKLGPALSDLIHHLLQVGFLVSIDKRQHSHDETTNAFPNMPEDFEFVFVQDDDAFFKSDEMNQLDEEIGDLDAFIKDTEALIVSDLEEEVLERESELRSTFSALADLDCALSLAGCAADLNFVRPEIVPAEEGVVHIENGRHPLQGGCVLSPLLLFSLLWGSCPSSSLCSQFFSRALQELIVNDEFIPNDTVMDNDNRVMIVTGPNFSGKVRM